MSILLLTLMLPSETPLKPFSESYVDFALPIEVQSCDNAFYVPYIVLARNTFNLKGLGLFMDCLNVPIYFFGRGTVLGALKDFSF